MSEMITIGKISKHHSKFGEVKCLILSDFPDRFFELERVFLEKGEDIRRLHVENVKFHKNFAVIKFQDVDSVKDAERLGGYFVKIPAEEAVELPEGHYFIHDMLGLQVYTDTDEYLGQLEDILTTGSNDVYIVKQGKKEIMLPAIYDVVKDIDLDNGRITVHLIEGLVD